MPVVVPKHAASLIVVDRTGKQPLILMGRRNVTQRFMPDVFVFPGGRVDAEDYNARFVEPFDPELRTLLLVKAPRARYRLPEALLAAALREADEESGLVFSSGTGAYGPLPRVRFVARAITPPSSPRRFDTRFFMIDRSGAHGERSIEARETDELTELVWVTQDEALTLKIHDITRSVLTAITPLLLEPHDTRPVPFYRMKNGHRQVNMIEA